MRSITIFTATFADDNMSEINRITQVGSLAPISLQGSENLYISAPATQWNQETTYIPDETLSELEIVTGIEQAFIDIQTGKIEAITMSVSLFLLMQQRPEFN